MVKTFEIDLDDALVENASEIFEALGTDIDSAIKIFLTQATLRQGFPFEVVIPNETENEKTGNEELKSGNEPTETEKPIEESESAETKIVPVAAEAVAESESIGSESVVISIEEGEPEISEESISEPSLDDLHGGITEDEELATATVNALSEPKIATSEAETVAEASEVPAEPEITESEKSTVPSISPEVAARVAANEALVAQMRQEIGDKAVTPEFDENEDDGTHETSPAKTEFTENESEPPNEEDEDETTPENLFDAWDVGEEEDIGCR